MLLAVSTSGLWRVLWYSLAGAARRRRRLARAASDRCLVDANPLGLHRCLRRRLHLVVLRQRHHHRPGLGAVVVRHLPRRGECRPAVARVAGRCSATSGCSSPCGSPTTRVVASPTASACRSRSNRSATSIDSSSSDADPVVELQEAFHRTEVVERMVDGRLQPRTVRTSSGTTSSGRVSTTPTSSCRRSSSAVLWFRNRDQWVRYMRRFATLLFVSCITFILLPTAPPWMAPVATNSLGLDARCTPAAQPARPATAGATRPRRIRRSMGHRARLGQPGRRAAVAPLGVRPLRRRVLLAVDQQPIHQGGDAAVSADDGHRARLLRRALPGRRVRRLGDRRRLVPPLEPHRSPLGSASGRRTAPRRCPTPTPHRSTTPNWSADRRRSSLADTCPYDSTVASICSSSGVALSPNVASCRRRRSRTVR